MRPAKENSVTVGSDETRNFGSYHAGSYHAGSKQCELSNHLGNVLATISDKPTAVDQSPLDGVADYYLADVTNTQDYYPFGSLMPGRQYSSSEYRFGFNGMEMDDEVKNVAGASLVFGANR